MALANLCEFLDWLCRSKRTQLPAERGVRLYWVARVKWGFFVLIFCLRRFASSWIGFFGTSACSFPRSGECAFVGVARVEWGFFVLGVACGDLRVLGLVLSEQAHAAFRGAGSAPLWGCACGKVIFRSGFCLRRFESSWIGFVGVRYGVIPNLFRNLGIALRRCETSSECFFASLFAVRRFSG